MNAGPDLAASMACAVALTEEALCGGADLVVLPENHCGIGGAAARREWAFAIDAPNRSPALEPLLALSDRHGAPIVAGGMPERAGADLYQTLVVLHRGRVVGTYRKIHLFEATMPDGAVVGERTYTRAGTGPCLLETPLGRVGLSVCYDLRFPELYRNLSRAGADMFVVPSAFTLWTGLAHWEPLLRARAIENQAYVLAPAQWGRHGNGRASFGHSMVVDPWGTVIAQASDGDRVVWARLDPSVLERARRQLPALDHRRPEADTEPDVIRLVDMQS